MDNYINEIFAFNGTLYWMLTNLSGEGILYSNDVPAESNHSSNIITAGVSSNHVFIEVPSTLS